jgi:hypothetical protein
MFSRVFDCRVAGMIHRFAGRACEVMSRLALELDLRCSTR